MNLTEALRQYKEYGVYKINYPTLEYIINELLKEIKQLESEITDLENNHDSPIEWNDLD